MAEVTHDIEVAKIKIMMEIHNRLAEISKYLEIGVSMYGGFNEDDCSIIKESIKNIQLLSDPLLVLTENVKLSDV